jgi:hypothetical protein
MVAPAPELAQHRTVLRNSGEHRHGHCVADQGQACQQTTTHCKEQISRIHNKKGEIANPGEIVNPDPKEGNSQGRITVLRNGLIQITLKGFFRNKLLKLAPVQLVSGRKTGPSKCETNFIK